MHQPGYAGLACTITAVFPKLCRELQLDRDKLELMPFNTPDF